MTGTYPSALLFRIATNVCLNRIRNEKKHSLDEYLHILQNTAFFENQKQETATKNLLRYILEKEKETPRKIAVMYFVNGMTIKEIAETMGLSISGVHKHLDKLRQRIKNKGGV